MVATIPIYAPVYARRTHEFRYDSGSHFDNTYGDINRTVTGAFLNVGQAVWEAANASGRYPFYNSYDNYAEELRLQGKDYSVIPEFKISDHIAGYLEGLDYKKDTADIFSLTGSNIAGNIIKSVSSVELKQILDVVADKSPLKPGAFGLRVKALTKLLPYEGFYPQQRTLQLCAELSESFKSAVRLFGNTSSFRTFMQPFVMPGVLYNTIKSGIAVDYPLRTRGYNTVPAGVISSGSYNNQAAAWGNINTKEVINMTASTVNEMATSLRQSTTLAATSSTPVDSSRIYSASYPFTGRWVLHTANVAVGEPRVPFEAILDPSLVKATWADDVADPLGFISSSVVVLGKPKVNYSMMANNFFAESVKFFLQGGELTYFESEAKKYIYS